LQDNRSGFIVGTDLNQLDFTVNQN